MISACLRPARSPITEGGGGQEWPLAYRVIREVAAGDGSIGQLLGYHYLWFWAARLVGTQEQIAAVEADATRNRWFFGGAVNPRDSDVQTRDEGDHIVYSGRKTFSTGSKISDGTVLEGTETHIFAIVPSQQPGITFHDDWDNIGQRLTESGSVTIADVRVPWESAAGFVDKTFQPRTYDTLNVLLGIAAEPWSRHSSTRARRPARGCAAGRTRPSTSPTSSTSTATSPPSCGRSRRSPTRSRRRAWASTTSRGTSPSSSAASTRCASRPSRRGHRRLAGDHEQGLRGPRRAGHRDRARVRPFLAQRPHPHAARPGGYKRREVGAFLLRDELPEPTWYS